jgi:competence protein ComEC
MQLLLLLGLLPLTVLIFDRVALLAPLVNFIAVPVFSFVTVPATLIAAAGGGDIFLHIAATSIDWLEKLIAWVASTAWADTQVAELTPWLWPLLLLPLAWALLPPGWPGRYSAWLALLALLLWRPAGPPYGCIDMTFMDVGQGLAVVLRSNRHSLLFDTGPLYRSGASAAEHAILPFLRTEGVRSLDKLLVSHADLDHAGGLSAILHSVAVADLLRGETLRDAELPGRPCRRGERWSWDGIDFRILHPPDDGFSGNDASCVLLLTAGGYHALLTGDIELAAEQSLLQRGELPRVDIVTVPHHGSLTSSSTPFAERLAPDLALVSAGYRNRWSLPRDEVVRRWQDAGATVLRTDHSGAIRVRMCQRSGVRILRQEREYRRRLWHEP